MIKFYFGYIPIESVDGEITEEAVEKIKNLTGDEIKNIDTVKEVRSMDSVVDVCLDIPSIIPVSELQELLDNGEKYNEIADGHNNGVVLMVPLARYNNQKFDIIDNRLNISIKDKFCKINCVEVSCMKYVLLCMFNDKWAYSTIGKDKIISLLKLIIKL
jgi:hypothetical protein